MANREELTKVFGDFDRDHSGGISTKELGFLLRTAGLNPLEADVKRLFDEFDVDKSGALSLDEFVAMVEKEQKNPEEEDRLLMESFKMFDKSNDGTIEIDAFRDILLNLGEGMDAAVVDEFMALAVGDDHGGHVDYNRLHAILCGKEELETESAPTREVEAADTKAAQRMNEMLASLPEEQQAYFESEEFKKYIDQYFDFVDADKSGTVDRAEAKKGLTAIAEQSGSAPPDDSYIDSFLASFDDDGSGQLSRHEFGDFIKLMVATSMKNTADATAAAEDDSRVDDGTEEEEKKDEEDERKDEEVEKKDEEVETKDDDEEKKDEEDEKDEAEEKKDEEEKEEETVERVGTLEEKEGAALKKKTMAEQMNETLAALPAEKRAYFESEEFKKYIDQYFDFVDADKSGTVDRAEAKKGLTAIAEQSGSAPPDDSYIDSFMASFDDDGSGTLDRNEFGDFLRLMFAHAAAQ